MPLSTEATEEIEALEAIFGSEFRRNSHWGCEIDVAAGAIKARLMVALDDKYPETLPGVSCATVVGLSERQRLSLTRVVEAAATERTGEVCLYDVATALQVALDALAEEEEVPLTEDTPVQRLPSVEFAVPVRAGETIVDRKSTFQAFIAVDVTSPQHLHWALQRLVSQFKLAKATHNMYAYRYVQNGILHADHDDDGEDAAGTKMAHILDLFQATNILVMVSRWYGGIKLGPDRFKHIAKLTQRVLEANGIHRPPR